MMNERNAGLCALDLLVNEYELRTQDRMGYDYDPVRGAYEAAKKQIVETPETPEDVEALKRLAPLADDATRDRACEICGRIGTGTPPVSMLLLFAPGLAKPFPLIPAEDYRVCPACCGASEFVTAAAEAHPTTSVAGPWTRAVIVFVNGRGLDLRRTDEGLTATAKP